MAKKLVFEKGQVKQYDVLDDRQIENGIKVFTAFFPEYEDDIKKNKNEIKACIRDHKGPLEKSPLRNIRYKEKEKETESKKTRSIDTPVGEIPLSECEEKIIMAAISVLLFLVGLFLDIKSIINARTLAIGLRTTLKPVIMGFKTAIWDIRMAHSLGTRAKALLSFGGGIYRAGGFKILFQELQDQADAYDWILTGINITAQLGIWFLTGGWAFVAKLALTAVSIADVTNSSIAVTTACNLPTGGTGLENKAVRPGVSPALASSRTNLYAAWYGNGGEGFWMGCFDGSSWSGQANILGKNTVLAKCSPALAAWGDKLYIAWKGTGKDIWLYSANESDWRNSGKWSLVGKVPNAENIDRPALAALDDKLYIAWRSPRNKICITSFNGSMFGGIKVFEELETDESPALAVYRHQDANGKSWGNLVLVWRKKKEHSIWWTIYRDDPKRRNPDAKDYIDGRSWTWAKYISNVGSKYSPALAVDDHGLYAAWYGSGNDGIFYATFDLKEENWSPQKKFNDVKLSQPPALGISPAIFKESPLAVSSGVNYEEEVKGPKLILLWKSKDPHTHMEYDMIRDAD